MKNSARTTVREGNKVQIFRRCLNTGMELFPLVRKLLTLNDLERPTGRYCAL